MGIATLKIELEVVTDDSETTIAYNRTVRWAPAIDGGERDEVTISATTFQALTVPTGAKAVLIVPEAGVISLTLKGVTGDTGTTIRPASNPINGPFFTELGATPSIGILNGHSSSQKVRVYWL